MTKPSRIVGIYLAAGKSVRMGRNKLSLPLGEHPLWEFALQAAIQSNLDHIIVVKSAGDPTVTEGNIDSFKKITIIQCPDSDIGLSYSLNCGIQSAAALNPEGAVILLADQPFIYKEMINQLIEIFQKENAVYVASSFKNTMRPPLLIGKQLFPLVQQVKGDVGMKELLMKNPLFEGKIIHYEDERHFLDIDTIEDYNMILNNFFTFSERE